MVGDDAFAVSPRKCLAGNGFVEPFHESLAGFEPFLQCQRWIVFNQIPSGNGEIGRKITVEAPWAAELARIADGAFVEQLGDGDIQFGFFRLLPDKIAFGDVRQLAAETCVDAVGETCFRQLKSFGDMVFRWLWNSWEIGVVRQKERRQKMIFVQFFDKTGGGVFEAAVVAGFEGDHVRSAMERFENRPDDEAVRAGEELIRDDGVAGVERHHGRIVDDVSEHDAGPLRHAVFRGADDDGRRGTVFKTFFGNGFRGGFAAWRIRRDDVENRLPVTVERRGLRQWTWFRDGLPFFFIGGEAEGLAECRLDQNQADNQ